MTRAQKIGNILGVFIPLAAFVAAIPLLWNSLIGWVDLVLLLVFYLLSGFGITVGYHRLFTHRSFETSTAVRSVFAVLGSMAVQGPVINWVADHRKHHAFTDEEGDPHSPHVGHNGGLFGSFQGLWHAHVGWLWSGDARADKLRYARDLCNERALHVIDRTFGVWVALGLVVPFFVGWAVKGTLTGALLALVWGGLVRIFLLHHVTFAINSLCHFLGARRFSTEDESRNLFWLAPLSFGEAWHHNHHAFPTSAFHGLRRRELDPGGLLVLTLEKLGLVWNVVRIDPERQRAKLASAAAATGRRVAASSS